MPRWTGLLPVLAFVMTVGISAPVSLTTYLSYRNGARPFTKVLQIAFVKMGVFYLLGIYVLWSIGAGISRVITALIVGVLSLIVLAAIPLTVGQKLVQYVTEVDSQTALRYTTFSWPLIMLIVFSIFMIPGGVHRVTFFHIEGIETCILGFCGISVLSINILVLQSFIVFVGPGVLGVVRHLWWE